VALIDLTASMGRAPELWTVVTVEGVIDRTSAGMVTNLVESALDEDRPSVVLDMAGVAFIDLDGLDALVDAERRARDAGVLLVLRSPSKRVLDMLLLTGVDSLFSLDLHAFAPAVDLTPSPVVASSAD
jgi:anti-anti-sigma factor